MQTHPGQSLGQSYPVIGFGAHLQHLWLCRSAMESWRRSSARSLPSTSTGCRRGTRRSTTSRPSSPSSWRCTWSSWRTHVAASRRRACPACRSCSILPRGNKYAYRRINDTNCNNWHKDYPVNIFMSTCTTFKLSTQYILHLKEFISESWNLQGADLSILFLQIKYNAVRFQRLKWEVKGWSFWPVVLSTHPRLCI